MEINTSKQPLQWHPAFYAGIQVEFAKEADKLIFENEHQLSKKPLGIDVLIIKKNREEPIKKNIGRIFRKHNIVEYKCPGDYISIDDFYKVYGYACFYKSDTPNADMIKASEITITFVCQNSPRKLLNHLQRERNANIIEAEKGIYYIEGFYFPIQLLVTSKLSKKENLWLRSFTNQLRKQSEVKRLLKEYGKHQKEDLYQAMMDVIIKANKEIFTEVNRMCEALLEIVEDDLMAREARGRTEGGIRGEILAALEYGIDKERVLARLCKVYSLEPDKAEELYDSYAGITV